MQLGARIYLCLTKNETKENVCSAHSWKYYTTSRSQRHQTCHCLHLHLHSGIKRKGRGEERYRASWGENVPKEWSKWNTNKLKKKRKRKQRKKEINDEENENEKHRPKPTHTLTQSTINNMKTFDRLVCWSRIKFDCAHTHAQAIIRSVQLLIYSLHIVLT